MYNRLDPIGEVRGDFRTAELASLIINIAIKWAAGKKAVKLTEITDFMPQWDEEAEKDAVKVQSLDEMKKALIEIANAQNRRERAKRGINTPPANLKKKKDG
jgi:hypothetical protein